MNDPEASLEKGAVPPVPAPEHPYAVLRNRNFLLYLIGRFIASIGQQMLTVAVGWELYERTHSALNLGLVGLTNMVPMFLFTLPAGHLADKLNRKRIIMAMTRADRRWRARGWRWPRRCTRRRRGRMRRCSWPRRRAHSCGRRARRFFRNWCRGGFPARGDVVHGELPALVGGRAGGGRRAHRDDGPRRAGVCAECAGGARLPDAAGRWCIIIAPPRRANR